MQTFKFENKPIKYLSTVTCNNCGKHIEIDDLDPDPSLPNMFQSFEISGGYGSRFDYEKVTFDLCDECLSKIIDAFVIPAETETLF
jgi:hypothetical protein